MFVIDADSGMVSTSDTFNPDDLAEQHPGGTVHMDVQVLIYIHIKCRNIWTDYSV